MDKNGDGFLDFKEFADSMVNQQFKDESNLFAKNLLNSFDKDQNGSINYTEFKELISFLMKQTLSEDQMKHEFELIDKDKNGEVKLKGKLNLKYFSY